MNQVNILGFAGSLRRGSYNRALLRASVNLMPNEASLEIFELEGIQPFNQDFESDLPDRVKQFKERIRLADGVLFVTPEHNYSIPGVLKNAIDWASRPYGNNSFDGKPAGIMSASTGMLGGSRAQYHLRQSMVFLNMRPLNRPEVFVTFAAQKFDANGDLTDKTTSDLVAGFLAEFVSWTRKLKSV